jgi:hypothetical protein
MDFRIRILVLISAESWFGEDQPVMQPLISGGRDRLRRTGGDLGNASLWSLLADRGSLTGAGRQSCSSSDGSFDWRSSRHSRTGCQGERHGGLHRQVLARH